MKSSALALALALALPSCTEPGEPEPPPEAPVAVFGPGACYAVGAPVAQAWNGQGQSVPSGSATLVIMGDKSDPNLGDVYLMDKASVAVCAHFNVPRAKLGEMVQAMFNSNQDLALVGSMLRPLPPPPPPPGDDAIFRNSFARYVTVTNEWARAWAVDFAATQPLPYEP